MGKRILLSFFVLIVGKNSNQELVLNAVKLSTNIAARRDALFVLIAEKI